MLALHLATNAQYDFHRDSLYYMDSARHPAWGYVDYPPVTPAIARLSLWLFGPSVAGLRFWPSLAGSVMVVVTALIARELGGDRTTRLFAALGAATSLVLLGANWLFQTVTFDQVVWLAAFLVLARLLNTRDPRWWLALGAIFGVGLETKYTVIGFIAGVVVAAFLTSLRADLRTPWPWAAAGVALLIFLPNLVWQAGHGWPSVEYTFNHKSAQSVDFSPLTFLAQQLALIGPLAIPLWVLGLRWLLIDSHRRALGIAALTPFVIYLFVGKSYYVGPLHPILIAAGLCVLVRWTRERRRWLRPVAAIALVAQALLLLPLTLPLLPESVMATSPLGNVRTDFAATVGWHDLVHQVLAIYDGLPPADRATAIILANNYGEAGTIETYGRPLGLPEAYSGELSYWYWGPPSSFDGPVIAIGLDPTFLNTLFASCTPAGTVTNSYSLNNEEFGAPLSVCRDPKLSRDEIWARLKAFR